MKRKAVVMLPMGRGGMSRRSASTVLFIVLVGTYACGGNASIPSGGSGGSGGAGATGGAASGGSGPGSGGDRAATGGTTGSGGGSGTGGTTASGGNGAGSGGTAGNGGSVGSGGTGGGVPKPGTPCSNNQDCGSGFALMCRAPGEFLGCGACQQGRGNCAADTDCAADAGTSGSKLICDPPPNTSCFCPGTRICLAGCRAKSDCPPTQDCNANHQCQNTCVPGAGTCPVDFLCGTNGFCGRILCTADAECSGACVKGFCYSARGSCDYTPI